MLEHQSFTTSVGEEMHYRFEQDETDSSVRARRIQKILQLRRKRERLFNMELFADPAWDMLLELYLSHLTARRMSVSSLCFASGVPSTTALRWVRKLVTDGLVTRIADQLDGRRTWLELTGEGRSRMEQFADLADV